MSPEELFGKLISNQISRQEFERLLDGLEDDEVRAGYETYLIEQFAKQVEAQGSKSTGADQENDAQISDG